MARAVTRISADRDRDGFGHGRRDWSSALGRVGLTARGVLYIVLGILTFQFAFGVSGGEQVSNQGAIRFVREAPFGPVLLWALAAGLTALALWQLALAVTGDPVRESGAVQRVLLAVKGLIYAAIAASVVIAGLGGGSGSSGGSDQAQATAFALDLPYGTWLVAAIGIAVVGYAVRSVIEHVKDAEFMRWLRTDRMDPSTVGAVRASGRVGYGGRAIVIGLTGGFLVVAAVQHSPDRSRGLAGSLLALSQQAYGTWLLAGVAVGLVLFGVFSMVEARYRRAA